MRDVLHISKADLAGGAARSAFRLHRGLLEVGARSRMFVWNKSSQDDAVIGFLPASRLPTAIKRRLHKIWLDFFPRRPIRRAHTRFESRHLDIFSDHRSWVGGEALRAMPRTEIANLHWLGEFLSPANLLDIPAAALVWTLHDINAFTGGCHFSYGCERFEAQCGACPQLGSNCESDLSRDGWHKKRTVYQQLAERLTLVCPSNWMAAQAARSSLFDAFSAHVIPYGIDTEVFRPLSKPEARQKLGLPADVRVVFTLAEGLDNERKGFAFVRAALEPLLAACPDLLLLTVGQNSTTAVRHERWRHLGPIYDERSLAEAYASADLFVIASLEDNLPNTALEAAACGLPLIGFASGGIPEIIMPGENGRLVPTRSIGGLSEAISALLATPAERKRMGAASRAIALRRFTLAAQAEAYLRVYSQALEARQKPG